MEGVMLSLALAVGGVLAASTRLSKNRPTETFLFEGALVRGQSYRLRLANPQDFSRELLEEELRSLGFEVNLATSDPTEPCAASFLVTWTRPESGMRPPVSFRIFSLEEVTLPKNPATALGVFGPGLLEREERALGVALQKDKDSKHLSGFAGTLFPDFPVAASLLNAKGILIGRRSRGVQKEKLHSVYQKMEHNLKALLAEKDVEPPLLTVFPSRELEGLFPGSWTDVQSVLPESFVPRIELWKAQEAVHGLSAENDEKTKAASLAILKPEAEPVSKALDELGYGRLFVLLPGRNLVEKAASLTAMRHQAKAKEKNVEEALWAKLRSQLSVDDLRQVSKLIKQILKEPQEMCSFPHLLSLKHHVSEPVARAAMAVLDEVVEGVVVVNPSRWRKLDPEGLLGKDPIPSSAFQLAFAGLRPEESGVVSPTRVLEAAKRVQESPEDLELLERAKSAIQRQKWVDWYERLEQTHGLETPKLTGR